MKEDDSGLLLALRTELRAKVGGRADDPHPTPFFGNQNQLRPLTEIPRIFSFRLLCGGEGCGRGQGSHGQSAWVGRQV